MPNWCSVNVEFYGDPEVIEELDNAFRVPQTEIDPNDEYRDYDLTRVRPCPEDLKITSSHFDIDVVQEDPEREALRQQYIANMEKYGHRTWYDWCVENWGTKWPPDVESIEGSKDHLSISGMSAWGPPSALIAFITAQYPVEAYLSYQEDGMCFAGIDAYVRGEMVYDGYFEYAEVPSVSAAQEAIDWGAEDDGYQAFTDAIEDEVAKREAEAMKVIVKERN